MIVDLQGVRFIAPEDGGPTVAYVPGAPSPELDPKGRPTLLLVGSDKGGILQLGARWTLDEADKVRLLPELSRRLGRPVAADDLQPAPARVAGVTLALEDEVLGRSSSSGFPPYTAIFNATLSAAQLGRAVSAIRGRAGLLTIEYRVELAPEVAGAATAIVRATDIATWFPGGSWQGHFMLTGVSIEGGTT